MKKYKNIIYNHLTILLWTWELKILLVMLMSHKLILSMNLGLSL